MSWYELQRYAEHVARRYASMKIISRTLANSWNSQNILPAKYKHFTVYGEYYNCGVRAHKLLMEALCHPEMEQFCMWCSSQGVQIDLCQLKAWLLQLWECWDTETFAALKTCDTFIQLHSLLLDYCNSLSSAMAKFWQLYIDMVLSLLCFICATRQGIWSLHKACIQDMLPWFFAYHHTNHAHYGTFYWSTMMTLSSTHPEAEAAFAFGQISVQLWENAFIKLHLIMLLSRQWTGIRRLRVALLAWAQVFPLPSNWF